MRVPAEIAHPGFFSPHVREFDRRDAGPSFAKPESSLFVLPQNNGNISGMAQPVRNFHLPLPEPTYKRLRDAAQRAKRPATVIARHAIETWLRQQRKAAPREAIAAYAARMAGTPADLDPELDMWGGSSPLPSGLDFVVDVFVPGSPGQRKWEPVLNVTLPGGGKARSRRMGWI